MSVITGEPLAPSLLPNSFRQGRQLIMKNIIHKPDATGLLHSVRNALGIISGNASLLELSTNLSEAEREQVKMISSAVFEISEQLHQLARAIEVAPQTNTKD
jgi:nitrogen-specific signal transduction histidine kinase